MTRINVAIPPNKLYDQHLIAEIKEINQLVGQYFASLKSKKGIHGIPKNFTLNTGHVKFFYDKMYYLHNRFDLLCAEAKNRNYNIVSKFPVDKIRPEHYNDYIEQEADGRIIMERILLRVSEKPNFYTYHRKHGIDLYGDRIFQTEKLH